MKCGQVNLPLGKKKIVTKLFLVCVTKFFVKARSYFLNEMMTQIVTLWLNL